MERTKPAKGSIRWVNKGGPLTLADGRKIPSMGSFLALPNEVPKAFRKLVVPVNPVELAQADAEPEIASATPAYSLKQRKGSEFFDIYDGQGKRLNDEDLSEVEAKDLLDRMKSISES